MEEVEEPQFERKGSADEQTTVSRPPRHWMLFVVIGLCLVVCGTRFIAFLADYLHLGSEEDALPSDVIYILGWGRGAWRRHVGSRKKELIIRMVSLGCGLSLHLAFILSGGIKLIWKLTQKLPLIGESSYSPYAFHFFWALFLVIACSLSREMKIGAMLYHVLVGLVLQFFATRKWKNSSLLIASGAAAAGLVFLFSRECHLWGRMEYASEFLRQDYPNRLALEKGIKSARALAHRVGFPMDRVLFSTGDVNSSHAWSVIYGSTILINVKEGSIGSKFTAEEFAGVAAHELGHWSGDDGVINCAIGILMSVGTGALRMLLTMAPWELIIGTAAGLGHYEMSALAEGRIAVSLVVGGLLSEYLTMLFNPLLLFKSRKSELAADFYAADLGVGRGLRKALAMSASKVYLDVPAMTEAILLTHPPLLVRLSELDRRIHAAGGVVPRRRLKDAPSIV